MKDIALDLARLHDLIRPLSLKLSDIAGQVREAYETLPEPEQKSARGRELDEGATQLEQATDLLLSAMQNMASYVREAP
jgi:hypothetical protein